MQTLDNVPRIEATAHEAWTELVRRGTPVIVTGAFHGQPIDGLRDRDRAVAALGDMPITVADEPTASYFAGRMFGEGAPLHTTLRELAAAPAPLARKVVFELPAPPALRALYTVPALCAAPLGPQRIHMAHAGGFEHLRYTLHPTHDLVLQVFGRKRYIIVPTRAAAKINPILNFGTALLASMAEDEKLHYLRYLGAYDCIVDAGQALVIPLASWHHAEYLELALTCSIRFAENGLARRLIDALGGPHTIHRDLTVHTLCRLVSNEPAAAARHGAALDPLFRALAAADGDPVARYQQRQQALQAACAALAPDAGGPRRHYFPMTRYLQELTGQLLASPELLARL